MDEKLYESLDWGRIEALVYAEDDNPHDFLGAAVTEDGIRIQAYFPAAVKAVVKLSGGKRVEMDEEDDADYRGFFAVMLPGRKVPKYTLEVTMEDGAVEEWTDPYNFEPQIPEKVQKKWNAGICYDIYKYLGAHPMTVDGVDGVYFAVWAPGAVRVSVVGDFNRWDGRCLPMRRLPECGIFELFVPALPDGTLYKYEIRAKSGLTFLKADPFGFASELRPGTASVIRDISALEWTDSAWCSARAAADRTKQPMSIYEVCPATWRRPEDEREFLNYREIAVLLADYVKQMHYTHVLLTPLTEYTDDSSLGSRVTGYFAPTARFGSPEDFAFLVNYLHLAGIGVLLGWVPTHFAKDVHGLIGFDGTDLFEHHDPRQSRYAADETLTYNYARPQVTNYLIANALFWAKVYHVDGLQLDDISTILYLDYGKRPGEWVPNMYGGNENLDAVEFLKHLDSIFHKETEGAIVLSADSSAWPMVTESLDEGGLGMDYKWNQGFRDALLGYFQLDPIFRGAHHQELIFPMVYQYSENFVLALPGGEMGPEKGSLYSRMPGRPKSRFANLRAALGYMMMHPGRKLLAMGQDFGQKEALTAEHGCDWAEAEQEENRQLQTYVAELLEFYRTHGALFEKDEEPEGFEWINNIAASENLLVFLRRGEKEEEQLLIVCNFSALVYDNRRIGVPFRGKYKEIFSSDAERFGGDGNTNPRVKMSREEECDEFPDSIRIKIPALSVSVFSCTPVPMTESENAKAKAAAEKKSAAKKVAGTKAAAGKAAAKKTAAGKAGALKGVKAAKADALEAEAPKKAAVKVEAAKKAAAKDEADKAPVVKRAAAKKAAAKDEAAKAPVVKRAAAKQTAAAKSSAKKAAGRGGKLS